MMSPRTSNIEPTRTIEWSHSRREILDRCPRAYYYRYYGSNSLTAKSEPLKRDLVLLKQLTNRYARIGDIAHLVIRSYLKNLQKGASWSLDRMQRWAREIFRQDRELSRSNSGLLREHSDQGPKVLLEFYYGYDNAEELCNESEERLLKALSNFMTNEAFADFRSAATSSSTVIEKHLRYSTADVKIRGKVDLAYKYNGQVVICDWKLGSPNPEDSDLQLLSYALWALGHFHCSATHLILRSAHLESGRVIALPVSSTSLQRAKARIIQDIEKMKQMDNYGLQPIADAFTPCAQPRICELCPFRKYCPLEKQG